LRLRRPSPALVISIIALFVALSGTGYAVSKVPKRSVGPAQLRVDAVRNKNIKAGAVSRSKIRAKAVTATQVATDSLLGRNILESSLTKVPDSDKLDGLDASKYMQATRIQRFALGHDEDSAFHQQGSVTFTASCVIDPSGSSDFARISITSAQDGAGDRNGNPFTLHAGLPQDLLTGSGFAAAEGHVLTADGTEIAGMSLYGAADTPGYTGRCVFGGWILATS
jgi:hypothetical protein